MGLFTPVWKRSSLTPDQYKKACEMIDRMTDRSKLLEIARKAPDTDIRVRAAGRAEDTATLVEICLNGNEKQRRSAFNALEYGPAKKQPLQDELARIAIRCPDFLITDKAVEMISDAKTLARVAAEARREFTARKAVWAIKDQAVLLKLAKEAPDAVRAEAVSELKNPDDVASFAGDPSAKVRLSVAKHEAITDPALHEKMALEDPDPDVRRAAVRNGFGPVSPAVLAEVLLKDSSPEVRKAAAGNSRCTDAAALARAVLEDEDREVREAAAGNENCTDPAALGRVALENPDPNVQKKAVMKTVMVDAEILARIAADKERRADVREAAIMRGIISDQALLTKIALDEEEDELVRCAAILFVEDTEALLKLAGRKNNGKDRRVETVTLQAAVRLGRVDREKAIGPLVAILRTYGKDGFFYTQKGLLEEAVSLITYEYRTTDDPAVRENISRLETGYYGYSEDNGCTSHTDGQVLWNPEAP